MKLKNILLTVSVAGMLFSCVAEDIIEPAQSKGGTDVTLDLSLKMSDISTTKAIGDANKPYKYAKPEELEVSQCLIAIFRMNGTTPGELLVKPTTATISGSTLIPTVISMSNDTLAYKIAGVKAKTGKVRVLVIANSALASTLSALKPNEAYYSDFSNAIETTQFTSTFEAKNLVKVGYFDTDLLPADDKTRELLIPMVQLAARVDLNIIIDLPKTIVKREVIYPKDVEAKVFDQIGKANGKETPYLVNGITYISRECAGNGAMPDHFNKYFLNRTFVNPYTQKTETVTSNYFSNRKFGEVDGLTIDSILTINSWGLKLNSITVNNIQTQTRIVIESVNTLDLKKLIDDPWEKEFTPAQLVVDTFKTTFYTYQKELYDNDKNAEALNVSIDANLVKGTYDLKKQYFVKVHGIWIRSDGDHTGNGWSNTGKFAPISMEGLPVGEPKPGEFINDTGAQEFHKLFTVWINPRISGPEVTDPTQRCNTNGVIHGNLYSTDVIFRSVIHEPVMQYHAVDWGTGMNKDIPSFE